MARNIQEPSSLALYLREITQYPLLTPEEEEQLGRRVAQGDMEARDKMIRANLRLVVSAAREFQRQGLSLADLVAEGNLGLMKAVERFDPEQGTRFSTYAIWWIRQAIRRAVHLSTSSVHVPVYMVELIARWKRVHEERAAHLGRPPTPGEMAEALGMSPQRVAVLRRAMQAANRKTRSTQNIIWLFGDVLVDEKAPPPEARVFEESDHEMIQRCMAALDEREAELLRLRYGLDTGEPMTLRDIGADFGLTRERVRQLEASALKKLASAVSRYENGTPLPPRKLDAAP